LFIYTVEEEKKKKGEKEKEIIEEKCGKGKGSKLAS